MPAPSGSTAKNKLPFPLETDGVDPPRDIKALAEKLDELISTNALVPIAGEAEFAGENDPNASWMVENGRAINRITYATLFGIIGTKYGAGDGSTTFNIPDTRGRVSIGAGVGVGLTNRELANTYGVETVTLTVAQMPSHSHPPSSAGATFHVGNAGGITLATPGTYASNDNANTGNTGGGESHTNIQPSIAKNKIIRVL